MRRIDTPNKANDLFGAGKHGFKNGLPGTADRPTELQAEWANALQEELCNIVEAAGITLNPGANDQLLEAVKATTRPGFRSVFEFMTPNQRNAVLLGTVMDLTAPCQSAIDSNASLDWPEGGYRVTKLRFDRNGRTYRFNNAQIVAHDTEDQKGLIDWRAAYCRVYGMSLVGAFKENYDSALYWHSASNATPAKSNHFFGLSIDNSIRGILFGELSPDVAIDAPQSENYIYGFRSRGVQNPVYCNQPNGFLEVNGEIAASKNEWDIENPGIYSYANSLVADILLGTIRLQGDMIKADTQLGVGFRNSGGSLLIGGALEVASQVFAGSGGMTRISDISGGYWGNATNSWAVLSGAGGVFQVSDFVLNKAAGASASNSAFVDFGGVTGWDVTLTNVRAENQLLWVFNNGLSQPSRWAGNNLTMVNCSAPVVDGGAPENPFPRVTSSNSNLLELRGTDVNGNDLSTWFKRDISGVGSISLNADVPAGTNYPNSIMVTPAVTPGSSEVISMDLTSLATVKATSVKCRPGDQFWLKGWFRMTTAGTGQVTITYANAAGAASSSGFIANQADILTDQWAYIEGWFLVPVGAAYFGVGVRGAAGTPCRTVGVKLHKLN